MHFRKGLKNAKSLSASPLPETRQRVLQYAAICEALKRTIKGLDAAEAYGNGTYGALPSAGG